VGPNLPFATWLPRLHHCPACTTAWFGLAQRGLYSLLRRITAQARAPPTRLPRAAALFPSLPTTCPPPTATRTYTFHPGCLHALRRGGGISKDLLRAALRGAMCPHLTVAAICFYGFSPRAQGGALFGRIPTRPFVARARATSAGCARGGHHLHTLNTARSFADRCGTLLRVRRFCGPGGRARIFVLAHVRAAPHTAASIGWQAWAPLVPSGQAASQATPSFAWVPAGPL